MGVWSWCRVLVGVVCLSAVWSSPAVAATVNVLAGDNLQVALDRAEPGDTILLQAGATFSGTFVLGVKPGSTYITVRTSASDSSLPADGSRISPADAVLLPKIKSSGNSSALRTAPGAHHWRLLLLEFQANAGGAGDVIALGDGSSIQNSLDTVPHDLVVDRVYLHGDPAAGQKRGIALNSGATTI